MPVSRTRRRPAPSAAGLGNTAPPPTTRTYAAIVRENVFTFINNILFALGHRARAGRPAGRRPGLAGRDHDQRRRGHRPGGPCQADAGPDRAADAPDGRGGPRRRGAPRLARRPGPGRPARARRGRPGRARRSPRRRPVGVDESQLTGESDVVRKRPGDEVFSGSFATTGTGRYVAEKVAQASFANQITAGARSFRRVITPLQGEINLVIRVVLGIVLYLEILLVIRGLVHRRLGWATSSPTRRCSRASSPTACSCRSRSPTRWARSGSSASARWSSRRTPSRASATSTSCASTRPAP